MGFFDRNIFKELDVPKNENTPDRDIRQLEYTLRNWLQSPQRKEQLVSEDYYLGKHDILNREKKVIGSDGELITINNVVNNKIVDNVYAKLVNQKTNFVLGRPLTIATSKSDYLVQLEKVFNKKLHRKLRLLAQYSIEGGVAYLYPYYDEYGEFNVAVFPSWEICPLWRDKAHTILDGAMRYYPEDVFDSKGGIEVVYHVDLFTKDGITHYIYKGSKLHLAEKGHSDYMYVGEKGFNWTRLPIIAFKYNSQEIPLIRRVKGLQDAFNEILSNFKDNMDEDPRTSILVLKNYDGTNVADFRRNLATYGVIKVTTVDGVSGGVEALKVEVNAQNYQAIIQQLKKSIIENGYGFDAKEERLDGDPNEMNINSAYVDIDLDASAMECEFQAGFEELRWFIDQHLINNGQSDYSEEDVDFVFNRDIFINENAKIDNCVKSVGVISNKTILARHPWVTNVEHELAQIEEDKQAELEEMDATLQIQHKNEPTPSSTGGDA